MLRIAYLAIALSAAFLFISCEEDPPKVPDIPMESIRAAVTLPEGGLVLAGVRIMRRTSESWTLDDASIAPPTDHLYVVRVNDAGEILWEHDALILDSSASAYYPLSSLDRMTATISAGDEIAIAGCGYDGMFVVRTDTSGTLRSMRIIESNQVYTTWTLAPTPYGGFLFAVANVNTPDRLTIVRTNSEDQIAFYQSYNMIDVWSSPLAVIQTSDNFIFILSRTACLKLSAAGDSLWTAPVSLTGVRNFTNAVPEPDGGFSVACTYANVGWFGTMALVRFNAVGERLWLKDYPQESDQQAGSLARTLSGGYTIAGATGIANYVDQFCLLFADINGIQTVYHTYPVGYSAEVYTLCSTMDGGFLLGGQADNGEGNVNAAIVRTTSQGNKLWSRIFGL
ncbi:hypothetical protein EHM69_04185 [candidate division KSB1 bacterium]|nr:MAG: hypothetical protein EHM69_04185 [candidate division KSB1 bacterium]